MSVVQAETTSVPAARDPGSTARASVDVFIPTFNERVNLPHALRSVLGWANRVFVVDSGSTDGTQEVARQLGAVVIEHPWEGYARQKNWALDNLPLESGWTFILDADEEITPALREEITSICSRPPNEVPEAGFYVNRFLLFMGKRIRRCGYFPSWNLRLFKRGMARYEDRPVHEHMLLDGREGYLRGLLAHEDRRGLEFYIAKHNRYSTLEAETIFFGQRDARAEMRGAAFGNAVQRRRFFKTRIYPKLPAKWFGRFVWMYFIKLGFLDGVAGLRFCLLISSHELFTGLKLAELQRQARMHAASAATVAPPRDTTGSQLIDRPNADPGPLAARNAADAEYEAPLPAPVGADYGPIDPLDERRRSPWSLRDKIMRVLWMIVGTLLFRPSFHNWYGWRNLVLRMFGAKIARGVRIRPSVSIEIPWHVDIGEGTVIGDYAILYSLGRITVGPHVVLSQYSHLCAGTHDHTDPAFPLLRPPIRIGSDVWIAADAFVGPGVTVGDRAIIGARATVVRDIPPGVVVAGNPARVVKDRIPRSQPAQVQDRQD